MEDLIQNQTLWTIILFLLLFFPVRQFIWIMAVRREERKVGHETDDSRRKALKRRAAVTSALLCFVFSVLYVQVMFKNLYGQ